MKTAVKLVAFMAIFVIGALVIGGGLAFGSRVYEYITRQGFDFQTAVQWSWDSMTEVMRKEEDKPLTYEFVNKNINVVACTAL